MPHTEPITFADILKEVDELLYLIERLNSRIVRDEEKIRQTIELRLLRARGRLADLLIERA